MTQPDEKNRPPQTDPVAGTKTSAEPPHARLEPPSLFPLPIGLTRADRRRIAVLAGALLRDPG